MRSSRRISTTSWAGSWPDRHMAGDDVQEKPGRLFPSGRTGKPPVATIAALFVITVFMILQGLEPAVLAALRRNLPALGAGEWWRVLSPLLVQADGLGQFAANFAGLAIVGAAVERQMGGWWWTALVLAGAVAGEAAGYAWDPTGAGSSLAVCGLAGGFCVFAWRAGLRRSWPLEFCCYWVAALTGLTLFGLPGAVALCAALAAVLAVASRYPDWPIRPLVLAGTLAGAVVLAAVGNDHGPALLAGTAVALPLGPRNRR